MRPEFLVTVPVSSSQSVVLLSEGGRLNEELSYVEKTLGRGAGATSEMVIQTPANEAGSSSVATADALLTHLEVIKKASKVVVERNEV